MGTSEIKSFLFNEKNIGENEILDFVSFYKEQLKKSSTVEIDLSLEFGNHVESVDELLYSYILLFIHDFPKTNINLDFLTNKPYRIAIQHIGYINLYKRPETKIQITERGVLSASYTTASKEFFPFLLINNKTCGHTNNKHELFFSRDIKDEFEFFISSLDKTQIKHLKENINSKESFLKQIKKIKSEKIKGISDLFWHYIFNSLSHLNVLRFLFNNSIDSRKKYKIRNLTLVKSEKLAISVLETLHDKDFFKFSYIELFVFNILVLNRDSFVIDEKEKGDEVFVLDYNAHLVHLFNETKQIVTGLKELSKNIVEHSGKQGIHSGFGVISARIHKKYKLEILKDDRLKEWCKGYKSEQDKDSLFLDINVIDSGLVSVTSKYKTNIQNEILKYSENNLTKSYKILGNLLKEDLKKINEEKYTFSRFLDYKKIELQHQIYRANARLGLLIFSNLVIDKKGGIIKISSTDINSGENENAYLYRDATNLIVDNGLKVNRFNNLGTNYNFIIPIELKDSFIEETPNKPGTGTPTSTLKTLFNYEVINYNSQINDVNKTYIIQNIPYQKKVDKYEKIFTFSETIIETVKSKQNNSIALINAQEVSSVLVDSSDWIRLLASVQLSNDIPLIIYNIDFEVHQEIITINKVYDAGGRFWNENASTLFYLKLKTPFEYKHRVKINNEFQTLDLWFCDVLYGKSYKDYLLLNRSISNYHHNIYSITNHSAELPDNEILIKNSELFSKDGKLLNFELFIKNNNDLTLFEESVKSLLNLEVCTLPDTNLFKDNIENKEKFFYKFKGYKVSSSHFKLGSKIHISDFFYAKRLFHNSFFANRFAFLVAQFIIENHLKHVENSNDEVFLIGYSHYSELLVSNTRRLLEEKGYSNIKHDVILENKKVLKNASKISERVITIIPISSTFSTSDKIKKWLNDILIDNGRKSINETWSDINVLLVANKDFEYFEDNSQLYNEFGWKQWRDNNPETKILMKRVSGSYNKLSTQKYFIPLITDWYPIHNCKLCFPDRELNELEKCLLETGVNSISPESIFSLPISRKKNNHNNVSFNNYIGKKPLVIQKHIKRGKKHYKQYIRTGAFLKKNKVEVENWLKTVKIEGVKSIIIITPSSTANSGFVNMVNEFVFSETATVLQYNNTDDILQNFINFNYSLFYNSTVVFVDDVLHTSESFHQINEYIKSIPCSTIRFKKIDYCFCIFNRLGYFDEMNVLNSLPKEDKISKRICSFAEIDVPPIKQPNYKFPDIIKGDLFDGLARNSVMDMMKIHFSELRDNVKAYDLDVNSKEPEPEYTHLFNFLIYKAIYNFFSGEFNNGAEFNYINDKVRLFASVNKEEVLNTVLKFVHENSDLKSFLSNNDNGKRFKNEVEIRIIYIFSSPPFSYYKDIKESTFKWLEKRIIEIQNKIISEKDNAEFFTSFHKCKKDNLPTAYNDFQTFKLYLRLAVELKSNYIFSIDMLNAIQIMLYYLGVKPKTHYYSYSIDYKTGDTLFSEYELIPKKGKEISPIGFITYYTGLIQQLIYKEEAKATELIKNIVTLIKDVKVLEKGKVLTLRNDFNNHFMNLLRILVLENTFIFDTFHNTFQEELKKLVDFNFENENPERYKDFGVLLNNYKENKGQASRFKALDKMLIKHNIPNKSEDKDQELEEAFQKTMYLKTLLRNEIDRKNNGGKIQIKVKSILRILCEILDIKDNKKCNGGAFFTVRYKNLNRDVKEISSKDLYTIANYATKEDERIIANVTSNKSLILEFFKGIKEQGSKKPKSTLELLYSYKNQKYYSSKIVKNIDNTEIDINKDFIETSKEQHYNNLFFLRVSGIENVNEEKTNVRFRSNPQAVLCFYKCNVKEFENCVYKDSNFCNNCSNNERLDPKRIRFLLLLRDDIKEFINYHLANDSFRAFVEKEHMGEYMFSLSHGVETYEHMIESYINRLNETEDKSTVAELKIAIFYLTNKLHLVSNLTQYLSDEFNLKDIINQYSVDDFIDEFKSKYSLILSFENELYPKANMNLIEFNSSVSHEYKNIRFDYPKALINEIAFEIIYNIRKYVIGRAHHITNENKLNINIEVERKNDVLYLIVSNNHSMIKKSTVVHIIDKLSSKSLGHNGLNLIYNSLKVLFEKNNLSISIDEKNNQRYFKVWIPLKNIK